MSSKSSSTNFTAEIQEIEPTRTPNNSNSNDRIALHKLKSIPIIHPETSPTSFNFQNPSKKLRIDWTALWSKSKTWIKNPLNMALFLWIVCVGISGAILFLVMTGMLNRALPKKTQRDTWFEVNNQILNALFTLMCLYQHPRRFYHLVLLIRWKIDDKQKLRDIYCKNGTRKPNERKHLTVVIILLHVNCFAQYALCGLNLGLKRSKRPAIWVGICISVAICAPAFASLYNILSPLGKEYENEMGPDLESQPDLLSLQPVSFEKRYSLMSKENNRLIQEPNPLWIGSLFDLWEEISLAYLSIFCSCCLLGWNLDRLGFGNMYVHIFTFVLFCLAPFFIFNLAAVNIDNETVRTALGITGFVLCVFGLFYGGFWRIRVRKRFNLPASRFCFGKADLTDCFTWLCCCFCALAQEVRTADFYEVVESKFWYKEMDQIEEGSMKSLRLNGVFVSDWNEAEKGGNISVDVPPDLVRISKE